MDYQHKQPEGMPESIASVIMTAEITRADGTKEDLGVISAYHKDPQKHHELIEDILRRHGHKGNA